MGLSKRLHLIKVAVSGNVRQDKEEWLSHQSSKSEDPQISHSGSKAYRM